MRTVILSVYEISKLISDPQLYAEMPEMAVVQSVAKQYQEALAKAPAAPCGNCGGRAGQVRTPETKSLQKTAVQLFISKMGSASSASIDNLKKRFKADKIELQYFSDATKQMAKVLL